MATNLGKRRLPTFAELGKKAGKTRSSSGLSAMASAARLALSKTFGAAGRLLSQAAGIKSKTPPPSKVSNVFRLLEDRSRRKPSQTPPPVQLKPKDDWPEEHDIEILPRAEYPRLPAGETIGQEVQVDSSNVYSVAYQPEGRNSGVMYVRYLGGRSGSRNGPGDLYAYYNVPIKVYHSIKDAGSVGGAVWDELRERGSLHGHQYQYKLVATGIPEYVPRRATARGFRSRAIADPGSGRRGYRTSTLPEQMFAGPNRAAPNRAEPNRGRPGE